MLEGWTCLRSDPARLWYDSEHVKLGPTIHLIQSHLKDNGVLNNARNQIWAGRLWEYSSNKRLSIQYDDIGSCEGDFKGMKNPHIFAPNFACSEALKYSDAFDCFDWDCQLGVAVGYAGWWRHAQNIHDKLIPAMACILSLASDISFWDFTWTHLQPKELLIQTGTKECYGWAKFQPPIPCKVSDLHWKTISRTLQCRRIRKFEDIYIPTVGFDQIWIKRQVVANRILFWSRNLLHHPSDQICMHPTEIAQHWGLWQLQNTGGFRVEFNFCVFHCQTGSKDTRHATAAPILSLTRWMRLRFVCH